VSCPHSNKPCINRHLCEWCRVPNAYGFFLELDKRGKVGWVQKFIREADREATIANLQRQIDELQRRIERVRAIPVKGEADEQV